MNKGFTLAEQLVIVVITGILAAIAAPSFWGWNNRARVDQALETTRTTLQVAQREAIRRSKDCTVEIPEGTNPELVGNCLNLGDRQLDRVSVENLDPAGTLKVTFSFRGNTTGFDDGTMVFSSINGGADPRCLEISANGIGIMRDGDWVNGACQGRS